MEKYKIVSFIPARGGSKRIPRKNIKMMAGKPMLAWVIEASLKSKYVNRTFVSTEDKEIKEVSLQYGAEVIDRPRKFSEDNAPTYLARIHFKECLDKEKYYPDIGVWLTATSPLVQAKHIDEAIELYLKSDSPMVISVVETNYVPIDTYLVTESGLVKHMLSGQSLKKDYYLQDRKARELGKLECRKTYIGNSVLGVGLFETYNVYVGPYEYAQPYLMSREDSVDVNTMFEFRIAEMLLKERIEKEKNEIKEFNQKK